MVALAPLAVCIHSGAQECADAQSLSCLRTCVCGVISIFCKNGFGPVGKRPELGLGSDLGGPACQEARAQAEMVNTVKLVFISPHQTLRQ